jgi:glycosyltransferase involved in cell wall biosynthesis
MSCVLYICIPSYNEGPTVGVLLWRIRKVFQDYSREYEILVYDDASTDGTRDTLQPYAKVMPLTVIGETKRVGYARAVNELLRAASARTRYPRRDAVVLMQGDFTDQPEHLPELVKRFEGGADVVAVERVLNAGTPEPVRQLAKLTRWIPMLWPLRKVVAVPGITDPYSGYRLLRVSLVRDLLKARGENPLTDAPVWAANVELAGAVAPLARRVETVALEARWDLRPRESRVRPWPDAIELVRRAWAARSRRTPNVAA